MLLGLHATDGVPARLTRVRVLQNARQFIYLAARVGQSQALSIDHPSGGYFLKSRVVSPREKHAPLASRQLGNRPFRFFDSSFALLPGRCQLEPSGSRQPYFLRMGCTEPVRVHNHLVQTTNSHSGAAPPGTAWLDTFADATRFTSDNYWCAGREGLALPTALVRCSNAAIWGELSSDVKAEPKNLINCAVPTYRNIEP